MPNLVLSGPAAASNIRPRPPGIDEVRPPSSLILYSMPLGKANASAVVLAPLSDTNFRAGDFVNLTAFGTSLIDVPHSETSRFAVVPGSTLHIPISNSLIGLLRGTTLFVTYRVEKPGGAMTLSCSPYSVGVDARATSLEPVPPAPAIAQVNASGMLNLDLLTTHASLTVPFAFRAGDIVTFIWNGTGAGGSVEQRFTLLADANPLRVDVPKPLIEASRNGRVNISYSLVRGTRPIRYSNLLPISVNQVAIITPGTVQWSFTSNTFEGWVPQGPYVGQLLHVINGVIEVDVNNVRAAQAHVLSRAVPVVAGRVYTFSFKVIGRAPTDDGSRLQTTVNGAFVGSVVQNIILGREQTGTGTFTASITGDVKIGIFNHAVPMGLNRFALDDLQMVQLP